jgi:uncharacterized membrane protein YgcG
MHMCLCECATCILDTDPHIHVYASLFCVYVSLYCVYVSLYCVTRRETISTIHSAKSNSTPNGGGEGRGVGGGGGGGGGGGRADFS